MAQDWEQVVWKKSEPVSKHHDQEPVAREMSFSIQKAIQQARIACKMSQKDLALKLQVQLSQVIDYENGKIVPNNLFISKLEKALNTKLPRASKKKNIVEV